MYNNLEEIIEDVEPSHPEFKKEDAVFISSREVIRYKYIPPRLVKHIYACNKYSFNGSVYEGKAPISPFMNSNFDSSVIANLIQQRFVYGMPVERTVRFYNEIGIDLPKQTAHGLLVKASDMLDRLIPVLRETVLCDPYIHFDETYRNRLRGDGYRGRVSLRTKTCGACIGLPYVTAGGVTDPFITFLSYYCIMFFIGQQ